MSSRLPPTPAENRSHKGTGEQDHTQSEQDAKRDPARSATPNPDHQGQQGNTKINTTHQGLRQDR